MDVDPATGGLTTVAGAVDEYVGLSSARGLSGRPYTLWVTAPTPNGDCGSPTDLTADCSLSIGANYSNAIPATGDDLDHYFVFRKSGTVEYKARTGGLNGYFGEGSYAEGEVYRIEITTNANDVTTANYFLEGRDERLNNTAAPAPANTCLLYTSPSPRDATLSRMPSSA